VILVGLGVGPVAERPGMYPRFATAGFDLLGFSEGPGFLGKPGDIHHVLLVKQPQLRGLPVNQGSVSERFNEE
jgi:hypothetical protein